MCRGEFKLQVNRLEVMAESMPHSGRPEGPAGARFVNSGKLPLRGLRGYHYAGASIVEGSAKSLPSPNDGQFGPGWARFALA